ncbi:MAG: hypothetical protein ACR2L6_07485 [Gemmatimonadaceae bacterium]
MPKKNVGTGKTGVMKVKEAALTIEFGTAHGVRRKNFNLPQWKIDRARAALGAATETETIERALDMAVDIAAFTASTDRGLAKLVGKGGFTNYFDPPEVTG